MSCLSAVIFVACFRLCNSDSTFVDSAAKLCRCSAVIVANIDLNAVISGDAEISSAKS